MAENLKFAFFLGCTTPVRTMQYEAATRFVAKKLGIELVDIPDFGCCGFPTEKVSHDAYLALAARNFAVAEEQGLDIVTMCTACSGALSKVVVALQDEKEREHINKLLKPTGRQVKGKAKVYHFTRVLYEMIGMDKIKEHIVKPMDMLIAAPHEGCHYVAPHEIFEGFDDPIRPKSLEALIEVTGAKVARYMNNRQCCGGDLLVVGEEVSTEMVHEKMENIKKAEADMMVLQCPFCSIMYDEFQRTAGDKYDTKYDLPVIFVTQLLGMAMGYGSKALGLGKHAIKTKKLMAKAGIEKKGIEQEG
jgi:heterodisulfide reductase subunit B